MAIKNPKGYELKPWWPYINNMMEGGSGLQIEPLSVTANGEYTAPTGKAYNPVTVNVSDSGGNTITIAQKQSVTTAMQGTFPVARGMFTLADGAVSTKTIDVIFDGVEYKNVPYSVSGYGEMKNHLPDFTNYPFFVINKGSGNQWMLVTATAGSYEIEIKGTPTNAPYWNCHVTVTNEKNDTDLFVEGFIIDPANGEGQTVQKVIETNEFDVIAVDGVSYLHFTNSNGDDGIVTSVTGKANAEEGRVGIWGDVTITAKGSE